MLSLSNRPVGGKQRRRSMIDASSLSLTAIHSSPLFCFSCIASSSIHQCDRESIWPGVSLSFSFVISRPVKARSPFCTSVHGVLSLMGSFINWYAREEVACWLYARYGSHIWYRMQRAKCYEYLDVTDNPPCSNTCIPKIHTVDTPRDIWHPEWKASVGSNIRSPSLVPRSERTTRSFRLGSAIN